MPTATENTQDLQQLPVHKILCRWTGKVLAEVAAESLKAALVLLIGQGADLRGANLGGANLRDADLRGADLGGANLRDADLRGANLGGANLRGADLRGANLRDADLGDADLGDANLRGADLGGANLRDANLGDADLGGADLRGADLRGANLRDADLGDADLGGANLRDADLGGANLGGANLGGANLRDADLGDADLGGADLGGADLGDAMGISPDASPAAPDYAAVAAAFRERNPSVPFVPRIDLRILEAIEAGGSLEMSDWHTCGTSHCRAGWAIMLAGDAGAALEARHGSEFAGIKIYRASTGRVPDFFADNASALVDIRKCAGEQRESTP